MKMYTTKENTYKRAETDWGDAPTKPSEGFWENAKKLAIFTAAAVVFVGLPLYGGMRYNEKFNPQHSYELKQQLKQDTKSLDEKLK